MLPFLYHRTVYGGKGGEERSLESRSDKKGDGGGGVVVEAASPSLSVSNIKERQEGVNL